MDGRETLTVKHHRPATALEGALARRARQILDFRGRRTEGFGRAMFGEPAWDMLLAMYIAEQRGDRATIAELAAVSGASPSVALRWLNFLVAEGLAGQEIHPERSDALAIQLTDRSRRALEHYLGTTLAEWPA